MSETTDPLVDNIRQLKESMEQLNALNRVNMEGFTFTSMYDFVLSLGQRYEYAPLEKPFKWMREKQCFHNATILAVKYDLTYVEGFCCLPELPLPIHHAWCAKPGTTKVIDPTARHARFYFGVPFSKAVVVSKALEEDGSLSLLDDWKNNWPLLRMSREGAKNLLAADTD